MDSVKFLSDKLPMVAWGKFRKYRSQQEFFDLKIIIDDAEFQVHKIVLTACSGYFERMFLSSFKESQQTEITLNDVDKSAFSTILDYCYEGTISLDTGNAQDILAVASMLDIDEVQSFCAEYIKKIVTTTNCLGILTTAHLYNLTDLYDVVLQFTLDRFNQVVEDPESEFTELGEEWLETLLKHNELNVKDESEVFMAIIRWLKDKDKDDIPRSLDKLLPLVRFPLMQPRTLINLKKSFENLDLCSAVQSSQKYRELMDEAKDYHLILQSYTFATDYPKDFGRGERYQNRKPWRKVNVKMFAVGGWTNYQQPVATVERFNPYIGWEDVSPMTRPRCGVGVAILDNSLYAVGGHDGQVYLKSVERYDIKNDTWNKDVADMLHERTSFGLVVLNGYIYAIGGQANGPGQRLNSSGSNVITALDNVERYNPNTNEWEVRQSMQAKRYGAGVTVCDGLIYVVGGAFGGIDQTPTNSVECYDPTTDSWKYIAKMNQCRKHLGCASFEGKIYAVGGRGEDGDLESVECFDPAIPYKWTCCPGMRNGRSGIGVVEMDGLIYAVGGHNGEVKLNNVDCYCPRRGKWLLSEPLRQERLGGGLAVLKDLKYEIP